MLCGNSTAVVIQPELMWPLPLFSDFCHWANSHDHTFRKHQIIKRIGNGVGYDMIGPYFVDSTNDIHTQAHVFLNEAGAQVQHGQLAHMFGVCIWLHILHKKQSISLNISKAHRGPCFVLNDELGNGAAGKRTDQV